MATVTLNVPTSTSWKTTLFGALTALGAYLASLDGYYAMAGKVLMVAGPLLMGAFAKDSNVTGGTVVQPSSDAAKAAITETPTPTTVVPAVIQ
jgi:hypothetical protein